MGSLRRLLGRGRAPRPKEQEWLRLILLVRKLQRSQFAFFQRFDEVRDLNGTLASFRNDFGAFQAQLSQSQEVLGRLEQGLERGLDRIELPVMAARVGGALDVRLARLDALARNLREIAAAPVDTPLAAEMGATLAYLQELVGSFESLARRIEGAASAEPPKRVEPGTTLAGRALGETSQAAERQASEMGATLAYLQELVASFGALAERFEGASLPVPEPEVAPVEPGPAQPDWSSPDRAGVEAELASLRERLRQAELHQAELEAKHALELTQVADLAQSRAQRVEQDLKTKKRGLADLTQQNLALQAEIARLKTEVAEGTLGPPPPIPVAQSSSSRSVLADLMSTEEKK